MHHNQHKRHFYNWGIEIVIFLENHVSLNLLVANQSISNMQNNNDHNPHTKKTNVASISTTASLFSSLVLFDDDTIDILELVASGNNWEEDATIGVMMLSIVLVES